VERLAGTESRLVAITRGISDDNASFKLPGKWSIKDHIGHLYDLEALHIGRVNDFIFRIPVLRSADMSNTATNLAGHNLKTVDELIGEFITERNTLLNHLKNLDDETQRFSALHPRLEKFMRPVDMAYFTAEHDDHHIATIRILIDQFHKLANE